VPGGLPTEALVAHTMVAKFGTTFRPIARPTSTGGRDDLDRTMLATWSGRGAQLPAPVVDAMIAELGRSDRLFMDQTTMPVLAPGTREVRKD
jgi:transposase